MKNLFYALVGSAALLSCSQPKQEQQLEAQAVVEAKAQPTEFADPKYMAIGKEGIAALASGDVETWMKSFADNAVFNWSSGDSLAGKKAISDYWTERRGKVIDKMTISKDIWMAVKVNQPQRKEDMPGVWLMSWYQVEPTYKNGSTLKFWVHTMMHFDTNDKIDRAVQFIDRAPIVAALAAKKK
ncbi:MAG: nuclear transport factor 2 family protein [Bacteroidetes bacterium]|nr:nuclear transport factor 2 family protein [Bacteroidota bacterium]MBI3483171.1 nuclear transport factor 2 family protein [Bacteroidota bacterium]